MARGSTSLATVWAAPWRSWRRLSFISACNERSLVSTPTASRAPGTRYSPRLTMPRSGQRPFASTISMSFHLCRRSWLLAKLARPSSPGFRLLSQIPGHPAEHSDRGGGRVQRRRVWPRRATAALRTRRQSDERSARMAEARGHLFRDICRPPGEFTAAPARPTG